MTRVKPSATGAVLARAMELRRQGIDVVNLGTGEPDFDTPEPIAAAAIAAIRRGETRYTPIEGTAELRQAVCAKLERDNRLDYRPSHILVSGGAKQSLFNLCMAILGPGDEAIIPSPYWVSYPDMVRLADAEPVIVETGLDRDFKMQPEQLASAITSRTRLLILNSPSNPTGAAYSTAELAALGEVLAGHPDVIVASDEIYEHIYWGAGGFTGFATVCPTLLDRTVTINGVSKAYAMTGWRIGYAAGPDWLIDAMKTVQSQSTSNACSISQVAATAALTGDQAIVGEMNAAYRARHDYLVDALNGLPGFECRPGEGTFYAFPRAAGAIERLELDDDVALAERILEEGRVACVPGSAFGAPGYLRLSFACSRDALETAVDRLKRVLAA